MSETYVILCSVFDMPKYLINPDMDEWNADIEQAKRMTLEEAIKGWESLPGNYQSYCSIWSIKMKMMPVLHERNEDHILKARVVKLEKELATLKEKLKCHT